MSGFTDAAKHILATVAPALADAALGPFAPLANLAIAKIFGVKANDPAAISKAVQNATPEQLLALKQEGDAFEVRMTELGITRDKMVFDDLANARAMQVETKDPTVARLAWTIIGGFLMLSLVQIVGMVFAPDAVAKIPPQGWLLIGNVSGYLANESKQAASFYFGSTETSHTKDTTISELSKS